MCLHLDLFDTIALVIMALTFNKIGGASAIKKKPAFFVLLSACTIFAKHS